MKNIYLAFILTVCSIPVFAQYDYCLLISKVDEAINNNFSSYQAFEYTTTSGKKAYTTDISFSGSNKGYVYRDDSKGEVFFQQTLTNDASKFTEISRALEKCLVAHKYYWTKTEGNNNKNILFKCAMSGCTYLVSSGDDIGVILKIYRDKKKNIPVFKSSFKQDLAAVINDLANGYKNTINSFSDSGILGKTYKSNINFNQRGTGATIYHRTSVFDRSKTEYHYTDMITGYDMDPAAVLNNFESYLTKATGWEKGKPRFGEGVAFKKGNVIIELTISKAYSSKEPDNTHITIKNTD
ncbi:MAG: hypothetical protein JNM14_07215 [Ferruginibacter sp.]|nr:hypothetical protein [Ferruginibacter sp.]